MTKTPTSATLHPLRLLNFSQIKAIRAKVNGNTSQGEPSKDLAKTPPMGWNSWNWFAKKDINEKVVREVIDAIVAEGLRGAGYTYVVVNGGWRDSELGPQGGQTYPGTCGDAPGNQYFDPVILHNGTFETTNGYCTDVFFNQASPWLAGLSAHAAAKAHPS